MDVVTTVALGAFVLGIALGALALKSNFCTMGALSDIVFMGDWRRFRSWMLAAATALLGAQSMQLLGLVDLGATGYASANFSWLSDIVGGLLFGYGMTMAGGCGNKTAVRLGAGNLKSLVVFLVMGLTGFIATKGVLNFLRQSLDVASIDMKSLGMADQSLAALLTVIGLDPALARMAALLAVAGGLVVFCVKNKAFLTSPGHLFSGVAVGLLVTGGWYVTGVLGNDDFDPQPLASFTFVGPAGDALQYLMIFTANPKLGFGVAAVAGVVLGSFLAAVLTKSFHLEAFTDAQDMKRHLLGAVMMGVGGVLAGGCTFGQGITGLSTLALGSVLALASICLGGVWGLKAMEEGSVIGGLKAVFSKS